MLERKKKTIDKGNSSVIHSFIHFIVLRCSNSQHVHHPCLKSIRFLHFSPDHLRSTMESFPVDVEDHLRSTLGDDLRYCTLLKETDFQATKFQFIWHGKASVLYAVSHLNNCYFEVDEIRQASAFAYSFMYFYECRPYSYT